jgi:hypothetical protein
MSERDDAAAAYYEPPERRKVQSKGRRRQGLPRRLSSHVPIRFDSATIDAVRRFADEDGMTASAWIRAVVDREVHWRLARLTSTTPEPPPFTFEVIEREGQVPTRTGHLESVPA